MKQAVQTIPKIITLALGLMIYSSSILAASVNPYTYSAVYEDAIVDSKWQRGYSSEEICDSTECSSVMATDNNLGYLWVDDTTGYMHFSTNGEEDSGWRSEFRYNDSFSRGSSRVMTATLAYWSALSTSTGFTVAQLHMEEDDTYDDVYGPPARLEIIDESSFQVKWRVGYQCDNDVNDCFEEDVFSTSTSGWKSIQLETSGDYINVSVEGETYSYNLNSDNTDWPSDGGYYWKTGIYLQDDGMAYTGYQDLYW